MKKVIIKYSKLFSFCFLLLSILLLFYNLTNHLLSTILYSSISILFMLFIIHYRKNIIYILSKKYIKYFIIGLPIIIRLILLFLHYSDLVSDEATFYNTAAEISLGNIFNQRYIATFPYLLGYIKLLSFVFKLFGISRNSVIIFNIFLDIIGAFFAYKTMKKQFNKRTGFIVLLLWLYNPFNIIYISKCLPIIIVNTSFIITIYIFSCLMSSFNTKYKFLYLSILVGIMLGITNCFRPIMIIFIISIFFYYLYLLLNKKNIYKLLISFILILLPYKLVGAMNNYLVEDYTGYKIQGSASGWSIYVGSNYSSYGTWFKEPEFTEQINSNLFTPKTLHAYFFNKGIANYKKNGIINLNLMYQKGNILSGNVSEYTYNQFTNYNSKNIISVILKIYVNFYWFLILITTYLCAININRKCDKRVLIYIILVLGLFSSNLLVEVSPRYFTPMFVPLTLIVGYYINNKIMIEEVKND